MRDLCLSVCRECRKPLKTRVNSKYQSKGSTYILHLLAFVEIRLFNVFFWERKAVFGKLMKNVGDAECSRKRGGNVGSGPPFQTLLVLPKKSWLDARVAYCVCDVNISKFNLCIITKRRKWEMSFWKYQTHVLLCLLVALVFAVKISRNTYWFKVFTLILHKHDCMIHQTTPLHLLFVICTRKIDLCCLLDLSRQRSDWW